MVPVLLRHLEERDTGEYAGIVDQHVDWPEPLLSGRYNGPRLRYPADIRQQDCAAPVSTDIDGDAFRVALMVEPVDRDIGPGFGELDRHGAADPRAAPR